MRYLEIAAHEIPLSLLLEADPAEENVKAYLAASRCFAAMRDERVVGACIVQTFDTGVAEIHNVATLPELQGQGVGSALLRFVLDALAASGVARVELGTGSFGYQLAFYQRLGFRVHGVIKDYFLLNYAQPIYEHGIQHKDQLRLSVELDTQAQ